MLEQFLALLVIVAFGGLIYAGIVTSSASAVKRQAQYFAALFPEAEVKPGLAGVRIGLDEQVDVIIAQCFDSNSGIGISPHYTTVEVCIPEQKSPCFRIIEERYHKLWWGFTASDLTEQTIPIQCNENSPSKTLVFFSDRHQGVAIALKSSFQNLVRLCQADPEFLRVDVFDEDTLFDSSGKKYGSIRYTRYGKHTDISAELVRGFSDAVWCFVDDLD